jgi:hypothetical protein
MAVALTPRDFGDAGVRSHCFGVWWFFYLEYGAVLYQQGDLRGALAAFREALTLMAGDRRRRIRHFPVDDHAEGHPGRRCRKCSHVARGVGGGGALFRSLRPFGAGVFPSLVPVLNFAVARFAICINVTVIGFWIGAVADHARAH